MLEWVVAFALGGAFVFAATFIGVLIFNATLLRRELDMRHQDVQVKPVAKASSAQHLGQQKEAKLNWEAALVVGGVRRNARAAVVSVSACGFCLAVALVAASVQRLADLAPLRAADGGGAPVKASSAIPSRPVGARR